MALVPRAREDRWGALRQAFRKVRLPYLYILPAAVVMALITFYPIIFQIWMSFTNYSLEHLRTNAPDWVRLSNYIRVIKSGLPVPNFSFVRILIFNIVWTAVNVFFHVTLGVIIALAINTEGLPGKRFYRALFVIPWALPALVSGMIWRNMWHEQFGAINQLLPLLGLPSNIRWLTETQPPIAFLSFLPWSFFAVAIANIWLGWPFMMVIATGALQSIPPDLYEAAEVDGASSWQKFWKITVPLLRPAMIPAIMIGIMMTFNQFNIIYFVTGGGPIGLTEILVTQGFKLVNPQAWYGVASAFNIIVFMILAFITLNTNRITRATEAYYA